MQMPKPSGVSATLICAAVAACGSVDPQNLDQKQDTEQAATLVVYRGTFNGLAATVMTPKVRVNGDVVGICAWDEPMAVSAPKGENSVSMRTDITIKRRVTLAAGEVAYFKCNVSPFGLLVPSPMLKPVDPAEVPAKIFDQLAGQQTDG